jgi:hypothetical protein
MFCAVTAVEVGLAAGTAHAQARVQLQIPEGCGSEAQFQQELAQLVGNVDPARVIPQISIQSGPPGEPFTLRVGHGGSVRELKDADCVALFASAVVIVATQLRATSKPSASETPSESGAGGAGSEFDSAILERVNPATERRVQKATKRPNVAARPALRARKATAASNGTGLSNDSAASGGAQGQIGVALGVVFGETPGGSAALELHAALEAARVGARVALFGLSGGREDREARGVRVYEWGARGLFTLRPIPQLYAAAGVSVGRYVGIGRNLKASESAGVWDVAPTLELGFNALRRERFLLELALSGKWSAIRPRFEVSGSNFTVYQVPAWGAGVWLRGVWRFD